MILIESLNQNRIRFTKSWPSKRRWWPWFILLRGTGCIETARRHSSYRPLSLRL